ncbi:MAG: PIG-L family deacetylase [Nanoarchaeota archaeon]
MNNSINALCLVAHPDDETIWMGGTILKNKNWNWTIFSLCRKDDMDRMPRFLKVCSYYNAKPIISNLDDEKLSPISTATIIKKIKESLDMKVFDYLFTHGKNGEYGHIRHKEIHEAVKKMIKNSNLVSKKVYYFSYLPSQISAPHDKSLKIPAPNKKADLIINLAKEEYKKKISIITKIYGFKHPIFETLSCKDEEAFTLG